MLVTDPDVMVAEVQAHVGDALRLVATYDQEGYELVYVRPDAAERAKTQGERVHDELVLQGLGRGHLEDVFGAGDLECSVHRFEDLTAVHFAASEFSGLFVTVDTDADLALASFSETCKNFL